MKYELDMVSINLINDFVKLTVDYYKEVFRNRENGVQLLDGVSPLFSLTHALDMDHSNEHSDFIRSNIIAAIKEKISIQECSQRIIEYTEETYYARMRELDDLLWSDEALKDREHLFKASNVSQNGIEARITCMNNNTWEVHLFYKDSDVRLDQFSADEFKTKEEALNYISRLSKVVDISHIAL